MNVTTLDRPRSYQPEVTLGRARWALDRMTDLGVSRHSMATCFAFGMGREAAATYRFPRWLARLIDSQPVMSSGRGFATDGAKGAYKQRSVCTDDDTGRLTDLDVAAGVDAAYLNVLRWTNHARGPLDEFDAVIFNKTAAGSLTFNTSDPDDMRKWALLCRAERLVIVPPSEGEAWLVTQCAPKALAWLQRGDTIVAAVIARNGDAAYPHVGLYPDDLTAPQGADQNGLHE